MEQQDKALRAQTEREKYILAWNDTMIKIWKEQITLLGVIDTGRLLQSPIKLATQADGRFVECQLFPIVKKNNFVFVI